MSDAVGKTNGRRTDVLIAGAGPTGLALACDLRARGIDVIIIDKAAGPATTSRALGVQPRGAEILARLGALGDLPQRAVIPLALNFHVGERRLARIEMAAQPGAAAPHPLIIGQSEVEARLRARLAELDGEVAWGSELVEVEEEANQIKAIVRNAQGERIVGAGWLVGCDGAHSKTRKLAGIAFDGTAFGEKFLLADVRMSWNRPRREIAVWFHADGMFAAFPLPESDVWRVMAELPREMSEADDTGGSASGAGAIDLLRKFFRERVGDSATQIGDPSWISLFRFHRRLASTYRRGRILIAGDAAHIHSPFGGQGMNTGLGDAYNLGWKLASVVQARACERLLDTYEAERRPVAAEVLARTTRNTNIALGNSTLARLLRDHVFARLVRLPAVQRKLAASGSQLNVSYRNGPLARRPGRLGCLAGFLEPKPKAGDRGPNAPCLLKPADAATTLGEETRYNWALLLFGGIAEDLLACATAARLRLGKDVRVIRILPRGEVLAPAGRECADAVLEDHWDAIAAVYRPGETETVLLRPDGHLAWRASRPNAAGLRAWLSGALDEAGDAIAPEAILAAPA